MAQGILPFKYESEKKTTGMTALGGLPAYLDLAQVIGLSKSIQKHIRVRAGGQGWTDSQMVLAQVLLNLAGGKLPSTDFGENAAWWWIMILALNLNAMMKKLVLADAWQPKRMKAVRFSLINLPGRVVNRSRRLIVRLTKNHPSLELLIEARKKIAMLKPLPCG